MSTLYSVYVLYLTRSVHVLQSTGLRSVLTGNDWLAQLCLIGTTPGDADIEYIKLARKLEFYGIDLHVRHPITVLFKLWVPDPHNYSRLYRC